MSSRGSSRQGLMDFNIILFPVYVYFCIENIPNRHYVCAGGVDSANFSIFLEISPMTVREKLLHSIFFYEIISLSEAIFIVDFAHTLPSCQNIQSPSRLNVKLCVVQLLITPFLFSESHAVEEGK